MRGRVYRRHQQLRAKARATRYLHWMFHSEPQWITPRLIARRTVDRTPCSCWMCGNPRRFTNQATRQELIADSPCCIDVSMV